MTRSISRPRGSDGHPRGKADGDGVQEILQKHDGQCGGLIAVLAEVQRRHGYLPEKALRTVSEKTGRSLVDVYGVASFYRSFSLRPRGKHLICVCLGTACHVRGAARVAEECQRRLGIRPGETTPDGQFTLETVNCLGACAVGPVVVVDDQYFSQVDTAAVARILDRARGKSTPRKSPTKRLSRP